MNKAELVELLEELAILDLADGTKLSDHPCSVAIRAINKCFDDINFLRKVVIGKANKRSKRGRMLLGIDYEI